MKNYYYFLFVFFLMAFYLGQSACQSKNDSLAQIAQSSIEEAQLIKILGDIHLAEAAIKNPKLKADSIMLYSLNELYSLIFEKHQINRDQLNQSMNYYSQHPDKMETLYDQVNVYLEEF